MSATGIQGQLLEVTVVGCNKLKDTEWISRQDPYVCLEYANTKFRTRTCTDGGKNPTFQEKFVFSLIEGLREINVVVWNSNTLTFDDHIGTGRVQLQKVLSQGFDDTAWPLQSKSGRHAGEVRLILHYPNASKLAHGQHGQHGFPPSAPPYAPSAPAMPYTSQPSSATPYPPSGGYPPPPTAYHAYPNPPPSYPPSPSLYPPPPQSAAYPPQPGAYPPPPHSSAYPPQPGTYPPSPSVYPPSPYPPAPYPPPPQGSPFYPGNYPGSYPPY